MILPHCWDILIYLLLLYHAVLKTQKRSITSQTKGRYYELRRSQNFRWVSQLKFKKVRPRRANNIAFGTDQPTPSVPQKKRDSPTYPNPNRQIPILKRPENRNPNQDSTNGKKPEQECSTDQKGRKNSQAKKRIEDQKKGTQRRKIEAYIKQLNNYLGLQRRGARGGIARWQYPQWNRREERSTEEKGGDRTMEKEVQIGDIWRAE